MGATPYVAHQNSLREVQKTRGVNHILERRRDNVLAEVEKLAGVSRADIFRTASLVEDPNALDPQLMTAEQIDRGLNIVRTGSNPWKFWDILFGLTLSTQWGRSSTLITIMLLIRTESESRGSRSRRLESQCSPSDPCKNQSSADGDARGVQEFCSHEGSWCGD
ncbi:hypothetical protein PM082_024405 [Marasmius tenuissimus]|nr:hypothetical protein PM082_024405 [Marasmius tenuissimus]